VAYGIDFGVGHCKVRENSVDGKGEKERNSKECGVHLVYTRLSECEGYKVGRTRARGEGKARRNGMRRRMEISTTAACPHTNITK
jgi:hypothetical protein